MSYEADVAAGQEPGVLIDTALAKTTNLVIRAMMHASEYGGPLSEGALTKRELSQDLAEMAERVFPESSSESGKQTAFLTGMQAAYRIVQMVDMYEPPMITDGNRGAEEDRLQRAHRLLSGAMEYKKSPVAREVIEEAYPFLDPHGDHPVLTRRGLLTGLYLADIGERQKQQDLVAQLRRDQAARLRLAREQRIAADKAACDVLAKQFESD
jgi:hypothetical protein